MSGIPAKAIIVGSAGQDGTCLSRLLARHGTEVVGLTRDSIDITDAAAVGRLLDRQGPCYIYYLAAVHGSSEASGAPGTEAVSIARSVAVHVTGLVNFLQAIADRGASMPLFYAASSRVFGAPAVALQDETTPLAPLETYGITKAAGVSFCRMYRSQFGVRASCGILYNHESPLRAAGYVTQKLARAAAQAALGAPCEVSIRDLDARVDWGWAEDYVEAMRRIVGLPQAEDFIIASGTTHAIRDFAAAAFDHVGLDWHGHVRQASEAAVILRPQLCGSPAKLLAATGWRPITSLHEIAARMVDAQLDRLKASGTEAEMLAP